MRTIFLEHLHVQSSYNPSLPLFLGVKNARLSYSESGDLSSSTPADRCALDCCSARPEGLGLATHRAVPEGWPHRQRISERRRLLRHLNGDGRSRAHQQDGSNHTGLFPYPAFICTKRKSHWKTIWLFCFLNGTVEKYQMLRIDFLFVIIQ